MIDILGHVRFDGMNITYYGGFGYVMWLIVMFFAFCGVYHCFSKVLKKIEELQQREHNGN